MILKQPLICLYAGTLESVVAQTHHVVLVFFFVKMLCKCEKKFVSLKVRKHRPFCINVYRDPMSINVERFRRAWNKC